MPWSVTVSTDSTSVERPCVARLAARWRTRRFSPLGDAAVPAQNRILSGCRSADRAGTRLSVAAAVRVFGHRHATITRWLTHPGAHSATLYARVGERLHLPHIQCDELRSRLRNRTHTLWLWLALEKLTKIMAVLHLGARTQAAALAVVHQLHGRLANGCLPVVTSDGLNLYFYALTAHFAEWVAGVGRRARRWLLRGRPDLRAGQETLSAATAGGGHVRAALWDAHGATDGPPRTGLEWKAQYRVCRAGQSDAAADGGGAHGPDLVHDAGGATAAGASGVVAGVLSLRAAA